MTFALYRYGTIIERHKTRQECTIAAVRRGLAGRIMSKIELCAGVEIIEIRDITDQLELEDAIAKAPPRRRA